MIDVGFIDRVRGRIGVHDVLKGGVIKGEGFTGSAGESGGVGSPVGLSVGMLGVGSVSWVLRALLGGGVDLVVALCFLSSLMATSLRSL